MIMTRAVAIMTHVRSAKLIFSIINSTSGIEKFVESFWNSNSVTVLFVKYNYKLANGFKKSQ